METKKIMPSHVGHDHIPHVKWAGKSPAQIGMELDQQRRAAEKLMVPLHMGNPATDREYEMMKISRTDHAHKMFELSRGRGWRVNADGTVPYLLALNGQKDTPIQSKRSQNKRRDKGLFLLRCKENPKQNWSNWQRNHNGKTRAESLAA